MAAGTISAISSASSCSAPAPAAGLADRASAVDHAGAAAGADAEHDDAEEIAEIVPAAIIGHGIDSDLGDEERDQPGEGEDEAVPEAVQEARRARDDGRGALPRAGGEGEEQAEGGKETGAGHLEVQPAEADGGEDAGGDEAERGGSVQHLDFLTTEEKDVYKTSFEIDQRWLLELAADRTPYIDQAQSLNLFIPADSDKWDLMMLHFRAWELGIKSLYYLRSKSVQRAGFAGGVEADNTPELREIQVTSSTDYDECLACQ